jgi:hypothetical protein
VPAATPQAWRPAGREAVGSPRTRAALPRISLEWVPPFGRMATRQSNSRFKRTAKALADARLCAAVSPRTIFHYHPGLVYRATAADRETRTSGPAGGVWATRGRRVRSGWPPASAIHGL